MGVLAAVCALLGLALAFATWHWVRRPRTAVPGPAPLPLLGNALHFCNLPVVIEHFKSLHRRFGHIFRFYLGTTLVVVVTKPEDAHRVLVGNKLRARGPHIVGPLKPIMGNGLITSKGEVWKAHRRMADPCFHSEVLHRFTEAYSDGARFVCKELESSDGKERELYELLCVSAMRTVCSSMFGVSLDEMEPDPQERIDIGRIFLYCLESLQKRIFQPWLQINWLAAMLPETRIYKKYIKYFRCLASSGIERRRNNKKLSTGQKRRTLMDAMMEIEFITDEDLHDEFCTFLAAGTETTASAMGASMALLALYPEWQDKVQYELDSVYGTGGDYLRESTIEDIAQLHVVESVIKESLRLYPSIPIAPVLLSEDNQLDGGRYLAPKGSYVFVCLSILHRNPEYFPDPDKFDPSRFLDASSTKYHYSYLPFGAGSRKCVGGRFAILEMKTVLSAVLRRFKLLPGSTREQLENIAVSISGRPVTGYRVAFVPRDKTSPATPS